MKYLLILSFAIISFLACKSGNEVTKEESSPIESEPTYEFASDHPDSLFFSMNKSACLGRCPTYILKVNHSGKAYLEAKDNIPYKGKFVGQLSAYQLDSIKSWLLEIDYFNLERNYDGKITDVPATATEFHFQGKHHRVRNRWNGPENLKKFEKYLHKTMLNTAWKYLED